MANHRNHSSTALPVAIAMTFGSGIGVVFGAGFGVALDRTGTGLALGLALGVALGLAVGLLISATRGKRGR